MKLLATRHSAQWRCIIQHVYDRARVFLYSNFLFVVGTGIFLFLLCDLTSIVTQTAGFGSETESQDIDCSSLSVIYGELNI